MDDIHAPLSILKCANCGKDVPIYHKKRLSQKYVCCDRKCLSEYKKKQNPNYINCPICGELFYVKPSAQTGNNCCSYKCSSKLRKILCLGENNPNFGNKGSLNPIWKSDERISYYGYKCIRRIEHPFRDSQDFVFEHRLVAEQYLLNEKNSILINGQRYLSNNFVVHHIDFNKLNNDATNLCVMPKTLHTAFHNSLYIINRDEHGRIISSKLNIDTTNPELTRKALMSFISKIKQKDYITLI